MKKIKITEKQAKLLETLNSKKVLKVTKEQYNRIIESELNRPSLTETPELHEEEINEELFREFVNELYGLNEEGAPCKYEKLNKVMEAAGLIEGGKLVKEKFGKDARRVKDVVGKGLMKYEECGSVYEAVQYMEEAINRVEPEVGSPTYNSRQNTILQKGYNPNKGKYNPENEPNKIENLINDIKTIAVENKDEATSIIEDFLKVRSATKVSYLRQHDLEELLNILTTEFVNPRQDSMELDEREHLGGKRAVGLDILNVAPFSELPETRSNMGDYTTRMELRLPSLTTGDAAEIIFSKADLIGSEFQGPKMVHKNPGYIKIFKSKFGAEPVFVNITDKGADIDENLASKFRDWKDSYINAKKSYLSDLRDKGNSGLDEMDISSSGVDVTAPIGPLNQKPAFKSNVSTELEEANVNLKDVIINIPDEDYLRLIKRTPTFRNYFSNKQLEDLHVGDNKLTVNHTVYGKMKDQYPEGRTPFGLKNESKLTSKIYEALKKK